MNTTNKLAEKEAKLPQFTLRQLFACGVHYGHRYARRNPKMDQYIYKVAGQTAIIDLQQTASMLYKALQVVFNFSSAKKKILFVCTKENVKDVISHYATKSGQYYVNHRWLGGMLTNWKTVSESVKKLKSLEELLESEDLNNLIKKERLNVKRQKDKLERSLGGIADMNGLPDLIVVIGVDKEKIAVTEAKKLGIPVVAVVDTACNPDGIDFIIPGNDDSNRAVNLYCSLFCDAILAGIQHDLETAPSKNTKENGDSSKTKSLEKSTIKKASDEKKSDDKKASDKTSANKADKKAVAKKSSDTSNKNESEEKSDTVVEDKSEKESKE